MGKSIALFGLLIILLGLVVFQYSITSVPDLESPLTVSDARYLDADNSVLMSVSGADGTRFTVGMRGDLVEKPEEAALFYISHPEVIPYVHWPAVRSNDERRVLRLLTNWMGNHSEPLNKAVFAPKTLGTLAPEVRAWLVGHQIYLALKQRN